MTAGKGVNGCYFVLHDPATKQPLPNTRYAFALYTSAAQDNRELEVEGSTDAQGRTAYMRSSAPIDAARMVLVRTIGDGPTGASRCWSGRRTASAFRSRRTGSAAATARTKV